MKKEPSLSALPAAVPTDNSDGPGATGDNADFSAPDTATPNFAGSKTRPLPPAGAAPADPLQQSSGRRDPLSRDKQNLTILIAIVALAMALAAVFRVYNPKETMPPCSEQPEWNQYNCRSG